MSGPLLDHIGFKLVTAGWFLFTVKYMNESVYYKDRQTKLFEEYIKKLSDKKEKWCWIRQELKPSSSTLDQNMGKPKQEKTQEERLTEGISLLKQLREAGIKDNGMGFQLVKAQISEWVKSGESYMGTISFAEHGRVAELQLPKYNNKSADIRLKVKREY